MKRRIVSFAIFALVLVAACYFATRKHQTIVYDSSGRLRYTDVLAGDPQIPIITRQSVNDYQCLPNPGNPPSGYVRFYCDSSSGQMTTINSSGIVTPIGSGGSSAVTSGLIGQFKILPTETVSSLVDYSGSGNGATGTVGTSPSIIANTGGISCTGNGAVKLGAGLNSALTIQVFVSYDSSSNANAANSPVGGNGNLAATNAIQLLLYKNASGDAWGSPIAGGVRLRTFSPGNTFKVSSISSFAGLGSITFTMGKPGGGDTHDHLFINGTEVQYGQSAFDSAGLQTAGFYQLCGAAAGSGNAAQTYLTGNVYYALFYNRVLTPAEIGQNTAAINQEMINRAVVASSVSLASQTIAPSTDRTNQLVVLGDSESSGAATGIDFWPNVMGLNGTWNIANQAFPGLLSASALAAEQNQYTTGTLYKNGAGSNSLIYWIGTNDSNGTTSADNNRQIGLTAQAFGFRTLPATMMSRTGQDTNKNLLNASLRQQFPFYANGLVDIASDANLGADGASANTTYFTSGVHITTYAVNNLVSYYFQYAQNALFGSRDWSSANTYTTTAAAPTTITAATESGATVTLSFTSNPFPKGACIVVAGVTPAGYNSPTGSGSLQCWHVLTSTATQVTFTNLTTGLGAGTVFGTAVTAQELDADVYATLGGSAVGPIHTLQTCLGRTGQPIFRRITNTNASPWIITPQNSGETINGGTTFTAPVASATNHPIVRLDPILTSAAAGGCTWQASLQ